MKFLKEESERMTEDADRILNLRKELGNLFRSSPPFYRRMLRGQIASALGDFVLIEDKEESE